MFQLSLRQFVITPRLGTTPNRGPLLHAVCYGKRLCFKPKGVNWTNLIIRGFQRQGHARRVRSLIPIHRRGNKRLPVHVAVLLEPTSVIEKGIIQAYEAQRRLKIWRPKRAAVLGAGTVGLLAALSLRMKGLEVTSFGKNDGTSKNVELLAQLGVRYVSTAGPVHQRSGCAVRAVRPHV